ncbi:unnamed protein product [Phaedon cochleariae]|uniref:Uncharacterized protein n=1 Tax=Phaedon cochleariae TaxID=80249 RepID=A0A9N9X1C2_PHACE|nr:unnamed protein product [Phaedon cochleariae]
MHRKYKKGDPPNKNTEHKQTLKCMNKSDEKRSSATGTNGNYIRTKNRTSKDKVEKNRHHKHIPNEKSRKHDIFEQQIPKGKKISELEYIDLKDIKSKDKCKKTKRKDRESVFTNIENYLKSLSGTPEIQNRRSRSSEHYNVKNKNRHALRREKTIHVEKAKENSTNLQQRKETYSRHEQKNIRPMSDKRSRRHDSGDKQLFYCHIETSSPFQPKERQFEAISQNAHSKKHRVRNSPPDDQKGISSKAACKKYKGDGGEIIDVKNSLVPEMVKVNVHKRKKSKTSIVDEFQAVPVLEVKSSYEHKKHKSHKKTSEDMRSRSRRKKSSIENNKEISHSSQSQFQEKIEDDLKSYFIRIQNLIDKKLETILHANTSINKVKDTNADVTCEKTENTKLRMESRKKPRDQQMKEKKSSSRDKYNKEDIRDTDKGHRQRDARNPEQKPPRQKTKSRHRESSTHKITLESKQFEENINNRIPTESKRKRDSPIRSSSGKRRDHGRSSSKTSKPEVPQSQRAPLARNNSPNDTKRAKHSSPPKKHEETRHTAPVKQHSISQQGHSMVPKNEKHEKSERSKDELKVLKRERKNKPRIPAVPIEESDFPKARCDNFRVEGIEPPNLESGKALRDKSRKLECKTVSIIGIPSQMRDYTKYSTGLEEALERKKKTKRFKLYYKYSVDGTNCTPSNNVHSSGDKSIVSECCKFISDNSEDYSKDTVKEALEHEPTNEPVLKKDNSIGKNLGIQTINTNLKSVQQITTEYSASLSPEVQCKYFKAKDLVSSSSECSMKSKMECGDTTRLPEKLFGNDNPPDMKPRQFHDYEYWGSETGAKGNNNPRYFLPDPMFRYDHIYKNRNYQSTNLASKSDIHLSYNSLVSTKDPTKTSTFSDQVSYIEYSRRNNTIFDESNIYNSPSTSRRNNLFQEQKVYNHTKMSTEEYDARIEELLNRKIFAKLEKIQCEAPQRLDYFSKHWCSPAIFCTNMSKEEIKEEPVCQNHMDYWNGLVQKVDEYSSTPVMAITNYHKTFVNKEVLAKSQKKYNECGSSVQKSDYWKKIDKSTFFSQENLLNSQEKSTLRKEDPVDMMTQKFETCDVGTEINLAKKTVAEGSSTIEIGVEVNEETSIIMKKVDMGVDVKEANDTAEVVVNNPEVIAAEMSNVIQPKKRGKEKSILTNKQSEHVKPTPNPTKYKRQESDIAQDKSKPPIPYKEMKYDGKMNQFDEKTIWTEKKTDVSKVPIRKLKNNAPDSKPKSSKAPNNVCDISACKSVVRKSLDVNDARIQNCGKQLRTESRYSSKRSATAHTFVRQKPQINETKWYHSSSGKSGKFNSLKKSQSEISFRNLNLNTEESQITSLVCMRKFLNDTKGDVSSKSNAQSLDRYFGKSISSDAHTSTFFLTKDYKTADVSSYHKRKIYDEIIRKKMKKRGKVQNKSLAPQVFEVRFLTVDNFQSRPREDIVTRQDDSSSVQTFEYPSKKIPIFSPIPQTQRCLFPGETFDNYLYSISDLKKKIIETQILGLCKDMMENHQSLFAVQSKFIVDDHKSLGFIRSCEFCKSQPNFVNFVDSLCKSLMSPGAEDNPFYHQKSMYDFQRINDDHADQKALTDSDEEIYNNSQTRSNKEEEVELHSSEGLSAISTVKKTILTSHTSCPVLKSQNSFKYLYQSDSSGVTNEKDVLKRIERPMNAILGFSLRSDTYLYKYPETVTKLCRENVIESPSSEESGYGSTSKNSSSFANFFKRPKIAALLQPQSDLVLCDNKWGSPAESSTYLRMMKKCQEYAQKVIVHSQVNIDAHEVYEEIPLHMLLSKMNRPNAKLFGSEPYFDKKKMQQSYSQPIMKYDCLPDFDNFSDLKAKNELFSDNQKGNNEISLIYEKPDEMVREKEGDVDAVEYSKSFRCLALTPSLETVVSMTDPNVDEEFAQKILMSEFVISNINLCGSYITVIESTDDENVKSSLVEENNKTKYEAIFCYNTYNPVKLKRMVAKKFFENLLEVYEKENVFSSALMENNDFFENDLLSSVYSNKKAQRRLKEKMPKYSVGNRMIRFFAKKIFNSHSSRYHNTLDEPAEKETQTAKKVNFENEITAQVKQAFHDMFVDATVEARKNHRKLSNNDLKLIGTFVCKYRIGLLSHTELIASHIGRGFFETDCQLKGAVMYLMKNVDVDLVEFEKYCEKCHENS